MTNRSRGVVIVIGLTLVATGIVAGGNSGSTKTLEERVADLEAKNAQLQKYLGDLVEATGQPASAFVGNNVITLEDWVRKVNRRLMAPMTATTNHDQDALLWQWIESTDRKLDRLIKESKESKDRKHEQRPR